MYRILGIEKHGHFAIVDVAIAQSRAELSLILKEERPHYQAIWYVRA